MEQLGATMILLLIAFVIVLAICWIILPFALIGTKPLLREILSEMRELNRRLAGGPNLTGDRDSVARPQRDVPQTVPRRDSAQGLQQRQRDLSGLPPT